MKKIAYYIIMMFSILVFLPLFIVRGCSMNPTEVETGEQKKDLQKDLQKDQKKDEKKDQKTDIILKVFINNEKKIVEMNLEDYVKGVVAAEMPAEFEPEALKAQAVAARTYVYARYEKVCNSNDELHAGADICSDPGHCQAWVSKAKARKKWGIFRANSYWNKISRAVDDTRGIIILYDNKIINPVFHSNSGGKTENAGDVWEGGNVPYLKSVVSLGEENCKDYKNTVIIKIKDFKYVLKKAHPEIRFLKNNIMEDIQVLEYTEGGRVRYLKTGNIKISGTEFRKLFSLKSANFNIKKDVTGGLRVTTLGYGHGVGMSQWGANYFAKNGGNFEEILKYYYRGVTLGVIQGL